MVREIWRWRRLHGNGKIPLLSRIRINDTTRSLSAALRKLCCLRRSYYTGVDLSCQTTADDDIPSRSRNNSSDGTRFSLTMNCLAGMSGREDASQSINVRTDQSNTCCDGLVLGALRLQQLADPLQHARVALFGDRGLGSRPGPAADSVYDATVLFGRDKNGR